MELEILLRLNVFSARKLKPEDIPEVPFVFAGDPFQTINPTGFRWEDIKAAFTQKFILALDPSLRLRRRELNYRELSLNYRSSQNIVHFSNLIQALRVRLFDLHEARPQRPWEDRCGPVVAWYAVNHPDFWQVFKETNDITLILPCALGEEADTVEKDPVLKAHVTFMEGTPINVLSAERAKGSEFPRVAIYGFGRDAPPNLLRPLEGGSSHTDNRDASLPLEYFLNRLYVAASRPKNQLLVLDPPEHRAFWRFAMDEATQNRLLGELPQSGVGWTDLVTGMVEGNANGLRLAEAPDHEANARNYQEQGLAHRDPTFMRNAAFAWRNAGQPTRAAECRARALLFEGRCLDAGNEFRQVGMNDAAVDAWWESGEPGLTRIQREGNADPEIASRVEYRYANFLASSRATVEQGRALLQELLNSARQGETLPYASRPSWAFVIRQTFHKLCDLAPTDGTTAFWADLKVISRGLIEAGFSLGPSDLGNLHYHCHEFADAVECWTRANETSSPEFRRARALSTPFPDNLPLLHALGEDARVADELSAHPKTTLSPEISRIAGVSLTLLVQPEAALPHLLRSRDRDALGQLAIVAHGRGSVAQHAAGAILTLAVIREEWPVVLAFLKSGAIPVPGKTPDSFAKWLISQKSRLEYALARALARSPSLPDLPYTERSDSLVCQKPMAEMLRRLLLENGSGWLAQLAPEEAGAAIERAGHRGDALRFYTVALPAADSSKQCAKLANERGIVCLERQLRSAEDEGRKKQAEDLRKEIAARRANAGLGLADKLPDYPKLDGLDALLAPPTLPAPSPQTPIPPAAAAISSGVAAPPVTSVTAPAPTATHIVCQVDDLRFELFRNSARLNIQHETTGKTASLHLRENRIESADVAFVPASDQPNVHTCADWSLRVDLSRLAGEAAADLYLDASGLLLRFSLKPN
ncbi:MAG: hypothetical protein HUU04_05820 [Verrucomicrobiae bacterium]|nr:hypothetical protein [Verrucomicrobiae bacterium]